MTASYSACCWSTISTDEAASGRAGTICNVGASITLNTGDCMLPDQHACLHCNGHLQVTLATLLERATSDPQATDIETHSCPARSLGRITHQACKSCQQGSAQLLRRASGPVQNARCGGTPELLHLRRRQLYRRHWSGGRGRPGRSLQVDSLIHSMHAIEPCAHTHVVHAPERGSDVMLL